MSIWLCRAVYWVSFALKRQIIDKINGGLALKNNLRYYSDPVSLSGPICSKGG